MTPKGVPKNCATCKKHNTYFCPRTYLCYCFPNRPYWEADPARELLLKKELASYRKEAKKAAKELLYNQRYIDMIDLAKSVSEIERIMITARKEAFKDEF